MKLSNSLWLYEEILLLALRDKEGTIGFGINTQHAIAGAIAADLLLHKRISIENTKKKMVNIGSDATVGDPLLDECLTRIKESKRRGSMSTWVTRFSNIKNLRNRVARQLCQRKILRHDEDKVLLIFKRQIFPEIDHKPEKILVDKLRRAIFNNARDLDSQTVVLVALTHRTGILKQIFDKQRLKERKKRIEDIISGDAAGEATKEAIDAMEAAVLAAVIVPVVITGS